MGLEYLGCTGNRDATEKDKDLTVHDASKFQDVPMPEDQDLKKKRKKNKKDKKRSKSKKKDKSKRDRSRSNNDRSRSNYRDGSAINQNWDTSESNI